MNTHKILRELKSIDIGAIDPHNMARTLSRVLDLVIPALAELDAHPSQTVLSRDYEALYEHLKAGMEPFCLVDYDWVGAEKPSRDVARVHRFKEWDIQIGARGIGYGQLMSMDKAIHASELDALKAECERMNLEWVAPAHPSQTEDLFPAYRHDVKVRYGVTHAVGISPPWGIEHTALRFNSRSEAAAVCNELNRARSLSAPKVVETVPCPHLVNGSCPLHNLHCQYPKCTQPRTR